MRPMQDLHECLLCSDAAFMITELNLASFPGLRCGLGTTFVLSCTFMYFIPVLTSQEC